MHTQARYQQKRNVGKYFGSLGIKTGATRKAGIGIGGGFPGLDGLVVGRPMQNVMKCEDQG